MDPSKIYLLGSTLDDTPIFVKARHYSPCRKIPEVGRWVHVAACFCENGEWCIVDCQECTGGVTQYTLPRAIEAYRGRFTVEAVEYPFHLNALKYWLKRPYSAKKTLRYARLSRHWMPPVYDMGTTCSELLAYCDGGRICCWADKPVWNVIPTDYQRYALSTNKPIEQIMTRANNL